MYSTQKLVQKYIYFCKSSLTHTHWTALPRNLGHKFTVDGGTWEISTHGFTINTVTLCTVVLQPLLPQSIGHTLVHTNLLMAEVWNKRVVSLILLLSFNKQYLVHCTILIEWNYFNLLYLTTNKQQWSLHYHVIWFQDTSALYKKALITETSGTAASLA